MIQHYEQNMSSLLEALESNSEVYVTFRTKTNTTRVMRCSNQLSNIPEDHHAGRFETLLNADYLVCAYDLQHSAWRSFRKDSVISYAVTS